MVKFIDLSDPANSHSLYADKAYDDSGVQKTRRKRVIQIALFLAVVAGVGYMAYQHRARIGSAIGRVTSTVTSTAKAVEEQVLGATMETAIDL
jgi:hypothetical protein